MASYGMLAVLAVITLGFSEATAECNMTNPCRYQLGQGADFEEPEQLQSRAVAWSIDMTVDISTINYDWLELKRRLYNGRAAGPTIIVKKGDQVTVNLDPQDNVLVRVEPKGRYQYVYQFHRDNSPGTYWYHAHVHGSTMFQVHSGLSGIMIVEDKVQDMPYELASASCPLNCGNDIQLLFQPLLIFEDERRGFGLLQDGIMDYEGFKNDHYAVPGWGNLTTWLAHHINYYTTNGQLQPKLSVRTGVLYRFRMVNAGGGHTLELYITDTAGQPASSCEIREIAIDGVYLSTPREMHDGQTLLVPGAKADWLVMCKEPGMYKLTSFPNAEHELSMGVIGRYNGDLLSLEVSGPDCGASFPSTLPERPSYLTDLTGVADDQIEGRFVIEFGPNFHLNREKWSNDTYYRYKMNLGAIQEWQFLNSDPWLAHPLHMHVNHFQVISYNRYTGGIAESNSNNWHLDDIKNLGERCFYQHGNYTEGILSPFTQFCVTGYLYDVAAPCFEGTYEEGQLYAYGKCSVYYWECVEEAVLKLQCPTGTVFDEQSNRCKHRRDVGSCGGRRKRSLAHEHGNYHPAYLRENNQRNGRNDYMQPPGLRNFNRGPLSYQENQNPIIQSLPDQDSRATRVAAEHPQNYRSPRGERPIPQNSKAPVVAPPYHKKYLDSNTHAPPPSSTSISPPVNANLRGAAIPPPQHTYQNSKWADRSNPVSHLHNKKASNWEDFETVFSKARQQNLPLDSRLEFWGHDIRFNQDNGGTLGYSRLGDWRDVLLVPPLANITVRFVPMDYYGDVIIHCHILDHEDGGMMMNLEVVREGESTEAFLKSGNAYPGTCGECDRYPPNCEATLCDPVQPNEKFLNLLGQSRKSSNQHAFPDYPVHEYPRVDYPSHGKSPPSPGITIPVPNITN